MTDAQSIVQMMCDRYAAAVSGNDSKAYSTLFAQDAIRVPPGAEPEHGPEAIAASEQKDYDVAKWTISSRPLDALLINNDWVLGIAEASVHVEPYDGSSDSDFRVTKFWLLHRENDDWLIKRQVWNKK